MANFMECKVCGVTTYVIHDWVKNLPCQACEANKKTLEEKMAWEKHYQDDAGAHHYKFS